MATVASIELQGPACVQAIEAGPASLPQALLKRPSSSSSLSTTSTSCPTSRTDDCVRRFGRSLNFDEDFELSSLVLGTGTSGVVRQAVCRRTGATFAVKSFDVAVAGPKQLDHLFCDVDVHSSTEFAGLVHLEAVYETEHSVHLVMEQLSGGELFDRLRGGGPFTEGAAAGVAVQVLQAVAYMHVHGLVHRDVKPENVVFAEAGGDEVKLIDFGFACRTVPDTLLTQRVGSMGYVAPEVLGKSGYDEKCDIWSIGCVTSALLTMSSLYFGSSAEVQRKNRVGAVDFSQTFNRLSDEGQDFVRQLLTVDPSRRPSSLQALEHPWLHRHAPELAARALAEARSESSEPLLPRESLRLRCGTSVAPTAAIRPAPVPVPETRESLQLHCGAIVAPTARQAAFQPAPAPAKAAIQPSPSPVPVLVAKEPVRLQCGTIVARKAAIQPVPLLVPSPGPALVVRQVLRFQCGAINAPKVAIPPVPVPASVASHPPLVNCGTLVASKAATQSVPAPVPVARQVSRLQGTAIVALKVAMEPVPVPVAKYQVF